MNALIVTAAPKIELPESIVCAYASSDDCVDFALKKGLDLSQEQKDLVTYAYFRARYREGYDLPVAGLARINRMPVKTLLHHARKALRGLSSEINEQTRISNNVCSRIMSMMMEMV